jgi:hypothetical protein
MSIREPCSVNACIPTFFHCHAHNIMRSMAPLLAAAESRRLEWSVVYSKSAPAGFVTVRFL